MLLDGGWLGKVLAKPKARKTGLRVFKAPWLVEQKYKALRLEETLESIQSRGTEKHSFELQTHVSRGELQTR